MERSILLAVLFGFMALTGVALWQHGYVGIFTPQLQSSAGLQVLVDLAIALVIFLVWMWRDARAQGRNPWPWVLITLTLGSFVPLLYLLFRKPSEGTD